MQPIQICQHGWSLGLGSVHAICITTVQKSRLQPELNPPGVGRWVGRIDTSCDSGTFTLDTYYLNFIARLLNA